MSKVIEKIGKFIVLDGIDGAGKGTQTELLRKRLTGEGISLRVFDFPRYEESMAGALVGKMLKGDFGNPADISPYLTCLPYICDQINGSREIREWTEGGGLALSNRYFTSNVHQIGKIKEGLARDEYRNWLWKFGYEEMGILRPDLVVILLVDLPICRENVEKKAVRNYVGGQGADVVERDVNYQMEAAKEFRRMVAENGEWWAAIECCREGQLMSPEEIGELVYGEINRRGMLKSNDG